MIGRAWLGFILVCLGSGGAIRSAHAYVRYETALGNPFSWRTPTVQLVGYPHGLPTVPTDEIAAAMQASVSAWSKEDPDNATCSFLNLSLSLRPDTTVPPAAVHDNQNSVAIRDHDWTSICSPTKDGKMVCHLSGELALTTIWSRGCGEIVEADVEVNATNFSWGDVSVAGNAGLHDLQNALTHEMGHFIGLDHTCLMAALVDPVTMLPIEPVDNNGDKVPFCMPGSQLTPAQRDATLYPSAQPGDVDKRSLSPDDRLGLCSIYPTGTTPVHCGLGSSGGSCAVAAAEAAQPGEQKTRGLTITLALAGVLIAVRRRSSRR